MMMFASTMDHLYKVIYHIAYICIRLFHLVCEVHSNVHTMTKLLTDTLLRVIPILRQHVTVFANLFSVRLKR
jgi:hypothetical protein